MNIDLLPFRAPNYVIQVMPARPRQECMREEPKYHLSEVDPDTLASMCDEFRKAVFAKAGKHDPVT